MKRPEYVAVITRVYASAIQEGREPTAEEVRQLTEAFSRQGFTQGFYQGRTGPDMFGIREEQKEPRELFALARQTYEDGESQRVPITFYSLIRKGEPAQVGVKDDQENVVTVEGPVPEAARTKPLTPEGVEKQLSRTGGTPYRCEGVRSVVDEGLSLPAAALNALRREALEELSARRMAPPARRRGTFQPGVRYEKIGRAHV